MIPRPRWVFWLAFMVPVPFVGLAANESTKELFLWLVREDNPVEVATFVFLFAAGVWALGLGLKGRHAEEPRWVVPFYIGIGLAFLVVGMEEIAWGQRIFGFETPEAFIERNAQRETTLHNVWMFQGKSELFRLFFGVGGFAAFAACSIPRLRAYRPDPVLLSWFVTITVLAAIDFYADLVSVDPFVDWLFGKLSEVVEMMVGVTALVYVAIQSRSFHQLHGQAPPRGGA